MHWLLHLLGMDSGSGTPYLFWSGAGSDFGEAAIVGSLLTLVRHRNCEVHGCWRLARHGTAAGHRVCRHHHPDGAPSAGDVVRAHNEAQR